MNCEELKEARGKADGLRQRMFHSEADTITRLCDEVERLQREVFTRDLVRDAYGQLQDKP